MLRHQQAVPLKPAVDRARGVGVDARRPRELAHAGKPVPWGQPAARDLRAKTPGNLNADGQVGLAIDAESRVILYFHPSSRLAET